MREAAAEHARGVSGTGRLASQTLRQSPDSATGPAALSDLTHAAGGAVIFALPLMLAMEMWPLGRYMPPDGSPWRWPWPRPS